MSVQVHRCRFMDYERPSVSAMEFNATPANGKSSPPGDLRLAVGRSNGDIEIWNPFRWVAETVIPGSKGRSVEDLSWIKVDGVHRLFSVGGSDTITEWSLESGLPKEFARSDAGVVWAIAASPDSNRLAAATENGTVVIFDVSVPTEITFVRRLQSADTSLSSLAWKSATEVIAGGSDGTIRVWSVDQGRIVSTLRVDNKAAKRRSKSTDESTIVWAVKMLPKTQQIISGDSNGLLKIWDAHTLSLQQSLQVHEGDILCLAVDAANASIFSSSLDQKIVNTRLTDPTLRRWTIMGSSVAHSHDIRAMALYEAQGLKLLVSGGLEKTFVVSSTTQFTTQPHRKVSFSRFKPQTEVVDNFIVEWNEQTVQVWQVSHSGQKLKARVHIAGDEFLTSASFDPALGLLAVGSLFSTRLFLLADGEISPIATLETGSRILKFFASEKLVIVTDDDELLLYDTASGETQEFGDSPARSAPEKLPYTNNISLLAVNSNGSRLAVARHNRYIDVYDTESLQPTAALPSVEDTPTALAFRDNDHLIVATADRGIVEFDVASGMLTNWSRVNLRRMPLNLISQAEPAYGIFVGPGGGNRAWLWGPSWLATIDFGSTRPLRKRKHDEDEEEEEAVVEDATKSDGFPQFWITNKYKPVFFAAAIGEEVLVSEKPADAATAIKPFRSNRRIQL